MLRNNKQLGNYTYHVQGISKSIVMKLMEFYPVSLDTPQVLVMPVASYMFWATQKIQVDGILRCFASENTAG